MLISHIVRIARKASIANTRASVLYLLYRRVRRYHPLYGGPTLFQQFFGSFALAATLLPGPSLNDRLHAILADVANQPRTVATDTVPAVHVGDSKTDPALSDASCPVKRVMPSRLLRYGAQLVNALVVGNAVRRGSYAHVLFHGSIGGYALQYAAIDLVTDRLDRRAACDVQAKINAIFGLGALYNAAQTEFPK